MFTLMPHLVCCVVLHASSSAAGARGSRHATVVDAQALASITRCASRASQQKKHSAVVSSSATAFSMANKVSFPLSTTLGAGRLSRPHAVRADLER